MEWLRNLRSSEQLAGAALEALRQLGAGPIALSAGAPWQRALTGKLDEVVVWKGEDGDRPHAQLAAAVVDGARDGWTDVIARVRNGGLVVIIGGAAENVTLAALGAGLMDIEQRSVRRFVVTRGVVTRFGLDGDLPRR